MDCSKCQMKHTAYLLPLKIPSIECFKNIFVATLNDEEDGHTKQTIVEMICEDDDVLFQWTLLGMDEGSHQL